VKEPKRGSQKLVGCRWDLRTEILQALLPPMDMPADMVAEGAVLVIVIAMGIVEACLRFCWYISGRVSLARSR
jgi:hypothetical protein